MTRALLLLIVCFGAACSDSEDKPAPKAHPGVAPSSHGNGIDRASSPQIALLEAPEGATPCETALNAITAEQAAASAQNVASMFAWVAPRADFLAACEALPAATQACLSPRHQVRNRKACEDAKPATDVLEQLFKANAGVNKVVVGE